MPSPLRILVTGGCGFIGSCTVRRLIQASDHRVLNCDKLTYAANQSSLASVSSHDRYEMQMVDIADHARIWAQFEKFRPDAVLHLAAESHVDRSIDQPAVFVQSNVVGTFNLLNCARQHVSQLSEKDRRCFRFVHVSTDEVYGTLGVHGNFDERSRYDPRSPYAATKASADHLARAWHHTYDLPVVVTNCGNNYGPYQQPEKLIPMMILRAIHELPLPIYGDGSNVRDWIHVSDHVNALMTVLRRGRPGETYNIGGDNEQTNLNVVQAVCDALDELQPRRGGKSYQDLITFVDDRPGHDFRYAIDSSKIRSDLGWQPEKTFLTGLRETIQWYLKNEDWWRPILKNPNSLRRVGRPCS